MKTICLFGTLIVLAGLARNTPTAYACSCDYPGTPQIEYQRAQAVFVGTVTDIDTDTKLPGYGRSVSFNVEAAWKGVNTKTTIVWTGMGGADCGFNFQEHRRYVVYAYRDEKNQLQSSICSRTKLASEADEDLAAFGRGTMPTRTEVPGWQVALTTISIGGAILGSTLLILLQKRKLNKLPPAV